MVLVPARSLDVGPGCRLMTLVALVDLRMRLPRDLLGNHVEVHHVMTRRCLMALRTVHGSGRGVAEPRDRPLCRQVALGAILTEEIEVAIVVGVTGRAVQERFCRRDL